MEKKISREGAKLKIEKFFSQESLDQKQVRKIKRLAMKFHIRLKDYRKRFCKECFFDLKLGKIRISKFYKSVECLSCGTKNRWKIKK